LRLLRSSVINAWGLRYNEGYEASQEYRNSKPWHKMLRQKLYCQPRPFRGSLKLPIRQYAPHIVVVLVLGAVLAASYGTSAYAPTSSTTPKVTWSPSSVTITFSASVGHSLPSPVSFTCSPATTGGVVLIPKTSQPGNVALSAKPSSFLSCGSSPNPTFLSASCLVKPSQCVGTYQGMITVQQASTYSNLATSGLKVIIVVMP